MISHRDFKDVFNSILYFHGDNIERIRNTDDKSIRILSDGSITPSTYLINNNYIVANIKEPAVLEKLETEELISTIIKEESPAECTGCVYVDACTPEEIELIYETHYKNSGMKGIINVR